MMWPKRPWVELELQRHLGGMEKKKIKRQFIYLIIGIKVLFAVFFRVSHSTLKVICELLNNYWMKFL